MSGYTYPAQGGATGSHPHAVQTVTHDYPTAPDTTHSYGHTVGIT